MEAPAWRVDGMNGTPLCACEPEGVNDRSVRVDDLDELRRRIVLPVVGSLVRVDELEEVELRFDALDRGWPARSERGSVWLRVTARGEDFVHQLVAPSAAFESVEEDPENADWDGTLVAEEMAWWLYDRLWDWVVETRFAWGEDRQGDYVIPPPLGPPQRDSPPEGA